MTVSSQQQAAVLKWCVLIGNNFFVGVALAVILSSVRHISDKVFLEAAKVSVGTEQAGASGVMADDTMGNFSSLAETLRFPVWFWFIPPQWEKTDFDQTKLWKVSASPAVLIFFIQKLNTEIGNLSMCTLPPHLLCLAAGLSCLWEFWDFWLYFSSALGAL